MSEDYDPQQSDVVMADLVVLDEFKAEDDALAYGVVLAELPPDRLRHWHRQQRFLAEYGACGNLAMAARNTDIHITTIEAWRRRDVWAFKGRCEKALEAHAATLYATTMDRINNPEKGIGSDSLLIAANNAHPKLPGWSYRAETASTDDAPSSVLDAILGSPKGARRRLRIIEAEELPPIGTEGGAQLADSSYDD